MIHKLPLSSNGVVGRQVNPAIVDAFSDAVRETLDKTTHIYLIIFFITIPPFSDALLNIEVLEKKKQLYFGFLEPYLHFFSNFLHTGRVLVRAD